MLMLCAMPASMIIGMPPLKPCICAKVSVIRYHTPQNKIIVRAGGSL